MLINIALIPIKLIRRIHKRKQRQVKQWTCDESSPSQEVRYCQVWHSPGPTPSDPLLSRWEGLGLTLSVVSSGPEPWDLKWSGCSREVPLPKAAALRRIVPIIPHVCRAFRWIREYWQKCGGCLEKWSGWNRTNRTDSYGPNHIQDRKLSDSDSWYTINYVLGNMQHYTRLKDIKNVTRCRDSSSAKSRETR